MNTKVLFSIALPFELKIIKQKIKLISNFKLDISFFMTWVSNYNVIYNLENFIQTKFKPDFIINIWVCWKKDKKVSNDFFQVYRIKNKANLREALVPIYFKYSRLNSILSSETIITSWKNMQWENYVDMESYWIDFICNKEKIPCIILKKPFDIVWKKSKDVNINDLNNIFDEIDFKKLLNRVKKWLKENKKEKINLDFYKKYFRFTFTEYEIFKKMYNKFQAYKIDFERFYKRNKSLNKKEFLNKMQEK